MDHDLVADRQSGHRVANFVDDARGVGAANVKGLGLPRLLACGDHVLRHPGGGPHVVVVHAGGHHVDQHFVRPDVRDIDDFLSEAIDWFPEAVRANYPSVHLRRHIPQWRRVADVVEPFHEAEPPESIS